MSLAQTHQIIPPCKRAPHRRHSTRIVASMAAAAVLLLASCGHSSPSSTPTSNEGNGAATTIAVSNAQPGSFGDIGQICGPAKSTPTKSSVRGVTDNEIHIGVLNDAGNTLAPGLGAAYPKVAKAFAKWCNAAGGINGRKIVIEDRDAKLFNAASEVEDACRSDFMLVGGGAALDQPTIAPREKCKLGSIPALNVSYEDQISKLQAVVGRTSTTSSNWGLFRLLKPTYGDAFSKIGILALDTPDVRTAYDNFSKALESQGLKVTSSQAIAQNLDNVRTYIQPLVGKADTLVLAFTAVAIFQAMNDVGYSPKVIVDQGGVFSNNAAVDALAKAPLKAPIYSASTTYPLDQSADNATAAKIVELEKANFGKVDQANVVPWITWLLFAKSASQCPELTVECVIGKATADKAYTAGGLLGPIDMSDPTKVAQCIAVNRVDAKGVTYDKKVTDPDKGVFNCDAANVIPIP